MSPQVTDESVAVVEAPKAKTPKAKKAPAKKAAPKGKAPAKATKKASRKTEQKPREKKEGLRKPQVRVLQCLAKSNHPMSRKEISDKAPVDLAMLNSYIGSNDEAIRAKNDKVVMPSLLTLKAVKFAPTEDGGVAYEITATGRKALEAAKKAE